MPTPVKISLKAMQQRVDVLNRNSPFVSPSTSSPFVSSHPSSTIKRKTHSSSSSSGNYNLHGHPQQAYHDLTGSSCSIPRGYQNFKRRGRLVYNGSRYSDKGIQYYDGEEEEEEYEAEEEEGGYFEPWMFKLNHYNKHRKPVDRTLATYRMPIVERESIIEDAAHRARRDADRRDALMWHGVRDMQGYYNLCDDLEYEAHNRIRDEERKYRASVNWWWATERAG